MKKAKKVKMKIIKATIEIKELKEMAAEGFGNFVKAVVDIENGVMAIDAELHSDEEALLLENGSEQQNLWGINLYPEIYDNDWIEFDSMINLKPSQNNRSRGVDDPKIRVKIENLVNRLVVK